MTASAVGECINRALVAVLEWSNPETFAAQRRYVLKAVPREALERLEAVVLSGEWLPDLCVHDLRHTYATLALRRGMPIEVVSKALGHSRVSITLDVYRHALESERRAAVVDLFEDPLPSREHRPGAVA